MKIEVDKKQPQEISREGVMACKNGQCLHCDGGYFVKGHLGVTNLETGYFLPYGDMKLIGWIKIQAKVVIE